jgi:hypothetical protein
MKLEKRGHYVKTPLKAKKDFEDTKREMDEFEEKYCNEQQ